MSLDRLLEAMHNQGFAPADALRGLPPEAYHSDELHRLEIERIFMREWLCVGRLDQVPSPGDYRCLDLADEPLVVVRGDDRDVRVLSRVCRHRSMVIVEGNGQAERFVCPYHHWTYDRQGKLRGAPRMTGSSGFDLDAVALHRFRTETWAGFVFVNLDGEAPPLGPRLRALDARLAHYPTASLTTIAEQHFDCDWNWKVMVENFAECYHHLGSHRETVEPWFPADNAHTEAFDPSYVVTSVAANCDAFDASDPYPPSISGPPNDGILVLVPYPTHLLVFTWSSVYWMQVSPLDAGHCRMSAYQLADPRTAQDPDMRSLLDGYFAEFIEVNNEDMAICRGVQRGARSRFATGGPLSSLELPLKRLFGYLASRLRA